MDMSMDIVKSMLSCFGVHNGVYIFVEEKGEALFISIEDSITLNQLNTFMDLLQVHDECVEIRPDFESGKLDLVIKRQHGGKK